MYAEDRVLVGVIRRKRDLERLLNARWYRVPLQQMPDGVMVDYLAFFLSAGAKRAFGVSGIYYYARLQGVELVRRIDILPEEPHHPRAQEVYYLCQLGVIETKLPPIINADRRSFSFIYTTWDRFLVAQTLSDLYSKSDFFVSRVYYALSRSTRHPLTFLPYDKG